MRRKKRYYPYPHCIITFGLVRVKPIKSQNLSNNITINADGGVNLSTATMERANKLYNLTGDFYGSISVQRKMSKIIKRSSATNAMYAEEVGEGL